MSHAVNCDTKFKSSYQFSNSNLNQNIMCAYLLQLLIKKPINNDVINFNNFKSVFRLLIGI